MIQSTYSKRKLQWNLRGKENENSVRTVLEGTVWSVRRLSWGRKGKWREINRDEWEVLDTLLISLGGKIRTNVLNVFPYIYSSNRWVWGTSLLPDDLSLFWHIWSITGWIQRNTSLCFSLCVSMYSPRDNDYQSNTEK